MVKSKGAGYAIEAIIAIMTVFLFMFGTITVPEGQEWTNFRDEVSANDLSYTLKKTGYINHSLKNGETGSLKTAAETITEKDSDVSGQVSNLPINENKIAFYTPSSDRYNERDLRTVNSGDTCHEDLEEFDDSEYEELRTENPAPVGTGGPTYLYLTDEDPNSVGGGDGEENYDSLYVDNGTRCQFSSAEGPYRLEEIFKWEGEYYDFKAVDESSNHLKVFLATQPVRIHDVVEDRVNNVKTDTSLDTANFTRLQSEDYDTGVFYTSDSVDDISSNRGIVEDFLQNSSILFLADLDSSNFDSGDFLYDAGFEHVGESPASIGPGGVFTDGKASRNVRTYFEGLDGDNSSIDLEPAAYIVSNTTDTIMSDNTILRSEDEYTFSNWDSLEKNMDNVDSSLVDGEHPSPCYDDKNEALTSKSFSFPEGKSYDVINAELGEDDSYCDSNNDRAVEIDLDQDNDFDEDSEGPFLDNETLVIDGRKYMVDIILYPEDGDCNEGDCVEFVYQGEDEVELISRRREFPRLEGEKIAVAEYKSNYNSDELKLLAGTMHWLNEGKADIGEVKSSGISTQTFGSIQNRTYMPYNLNLEWSQ